MEIEIIKKTIDFDKLNKPWFDPIPMQCNYNDLQFNYSNAEYSNSKIIENNIHFIWIGSIIKQKYIDTIINCTKININYSIYLWVDNNSTNDEISSHLTSHNIIIKNIYDEFKKDNELDIYILKQLEKFDNYGYKADIIRLYVIYSYGGIYSDIDSVWLKPFDNNFDYEFVSYRIDNQCSSIGNCFFGFCKNSIILLDLLQNLEKSIDCIMKTNVYSIIQAHIPIMTGSSFINKIIIDKKYKDFNYLHQAYCVIGGPHDNLYNSYSKEGKIYCYQTFDKNWCL